MPKKGAPLSSEKGSSEVLTENSDLADRQADSSVSALSNVRAIWLRARVAISKNRRLAMALCAALFIFVLFGFIENFAEKKAMSILAEEADRMSLAATADDISVSLFRLKPSLKVENLSVAVPGYEPVLERADAVVSLQWWDLFGKTVFLRKIKISQVRVNLLVDEAGQNNWSPLLEVLTENLAEDDEASVQLGKLQLSDAMVEYINDQYAHTGLLTVNADLNQSSELLKSKLTMIGDVNYLPIELDFVANTDFSEGDSTQASSASIIAKIGDASLKANAQADDLRTFENGQLDFNVDARSVRELLEQLALGETEISEIELNANVSYIADDDLSSEFELSVDRSHATGELLLENLLGSDPDKRRRFVGSIDFMDLFLDPIISTTLDQSSHSGQVDDKDVARLFSTEPLSFFSATENLDIDFTLGAEQFYSGSLLVKNLDTSISKENEEVVLNIESDNFGQGQFQATVSVDSKEQGAKGKLYVRAVNLPINDILSAGDVADGMASGKLSGDAKFWFKAGSPAEVMGTLDGGMFLLIEEGKLDSLLVEMAGIDLMESIGLVINKGLQQSDVRCGFADIQAVGGLVTVKDFIIDTEDSVFLASGNIDFATETIDLKFSPHPRDTSLFAATTPIHIRGQLLDPKIRPGSKLYTRVALAAAMAALAGPAAIVLPFIEMGDGGDKSYCRQLFGN